MFFRLFGCGMWTVFVAKIFEFFGWLQIEKISGAQSIGG
jgi:hypothetical protein